jgi:hypothetical protein
LAGDYQVAAIMLGPRAGELRDIRHLALDLVRQFPPPLSALARQIRDNTAAVGWDIFPYVFPLFCVHHVHVQQPEQGAPGFGEAKRRIAPESLYGRGPALLG